MKKPNIPIFIEVLETLTEQGFIDVGPTEREYDLTPIYDFLVVCGFADRVGEREGKYWLQLRDGDACFMLSDFLQILQTKGENTCLKLSELLKQLAEQGTQR